jgi:hypothetical protein
MPRKKSAANQTYSFITKSIPQKAQIITHDSHEALWGNQEK